jgi:hypothetical protein
MGVTFRIGNKSAGVDGVLGIDGPAVRVDGCVETALFDPLLHGVVAVEAQALQFAEPELVDVAAVRLDVIGDGRRPDQAAVLA